MELNQSARGVMEQELRIVLVGKTGAGKSHTGNTLLGKPAFHTDFSSVSVTSECQKETAEVEGQTLAVIDTPDLFDTSLRKGQAVKDIASLVSLVAPGPHVFLVVIQPNRFTRKEEEKTMKNIQQLFGERAAEYTMALFTHGDDLEYDGVLIEDLIRNNRAVDSFLLLCRGGYHVFNNRSRDPQQVRELLSKINQMVSRNSGTYYTNEILQEAEAAIKEETKRLQRQNEELEYAEARRQAERENGFIASCLSDAVSTVGATVEKLAFQWRADLRPSVLMATICSIQ